MEMSGEVFSFSGQGAELQPGAQVNAGVVLSSAFFFNLSAISL